jgi:hypothetical protein
MTDLSHSQDYRILRTPCLTPAAPARDRTAGRRDLVSLLSSQKLQFKSLSVEVIRQLLRERQGLRDKNRSAILGEITDISSEISCCENQRYSPDAREMRMKLMKQKAELESLLREEDIGLWKDTEELRQLLIEAEKAHESAKFRADLLASSTIPDEDKETDHAEDSG